MEVAVREELGNVGRDDRAGEIETEQGDVYVRLPRTGLAVVGSVSHVVNLVSPFKA